MDMKNLLDSLPDNIALLSSGQRGIDRAALEQRIDKVATALQALKPLSGAVAILADNDPEWLVVDLASQMLGITLVPCRCSSRQRNGCT